MFEFTTLTVYNAINKANSNAVTKNTNVIMGGNDETPEVRIGNTRFNADNVLSIQKKIHTDEHLAKVTFDLSKVVTGEDYAGLYRIALYIGLSMNSQDSYYANDFVYKGKPLYIEFPIQEGDTAAKVAKKIKTIADKYTLFVMGEGNILNITVDGSNVTFEGTNGYQQFKAAVLQKYNPDAVKIDCCSNEGDFVDVITGVPIEWTMPAGVFTAGTKTLDGGELRDLEDNEVPIEPGLEAFGDYNWLIHNLRLPTLANTHFWSPTKTEMPVAGGKYNQYCIQMCAKRLGVAGEVVGQETTSVTTHVLYVLDSGNNITDIEAALTTLKSLSTDADTSLADPYASVRS